MAAALIDRTFAWSIRGVMLALCAAVGIYAGAWLARGMGINPLFGVALGLLNFTAAAIYRARDKEPDLNRRFIAALGQTSAHVSVFLTMTGYFLTEIMAGAACALVGHVAGSFVAVDRLPLSAGIFGGVVALGLMFRSALHDTENLSPRAAGTGYGAAYRSETLQALLAAGLSIDSGRGIWAGIVREHVPNRRYFWQFWRKPFVMRDFWLTYDGQNSAVTVAESGTGKFAGSLCPTLLTNKMASIIALDPKKELLCVTAKQREAFGQKVVAFNHFNILPDEKSEYPNSRINPLGALDIAAVSFESSINKLAAILAPVDPNDHNKFFAESAQSLIAAVMIWCMELFGKRANLPQVAELLHLPPFQQNKLFERMANESQFLFVRAVAARYWEKVNAKGEAQHEVAPSKAGVLASASRETVWLLEGANAKEPHKSTGMAHLFGYGSDGDFFDWKQLKTEKITVYIVLPVDVMEAYKKMTMLLIGGAIDALVKEPVADVLLLLDELPNALGADVVPYIRRAFNVGRYVGLKTHLFAQNWPQLQRLFGNEVDVASGAGLLNFFGANDPVTAEAIRNRRGKQTIWAENSSAMAQINGVPAMGADLLTDQELQDMIKDGRQVAYVLGHGGTIIMPRKPFYYEEPELKKRADKNPYAG
jgi:type IV secretory pathway TraG/TraD family ATPase VirD4